MAYSCVIIKGLPSEIASLVQAYLTSENPTTIHSIATFKVGQMVQVLICTE